VALSRLTPLYRAALVMREIGGMRYADIAQALEQKAKNVDVLLFRAVPGFRQEYLKAMESTGLPTSIARRRHGCCLPMWMTRIGPNGSSSG